MRVLEYCVFETESRQDSEMLKMMKLLSNQVMRIEKQLEEKVDRVTMADLEEKVKGITGADASEGKDDVTTEEMMVKGRSMAQVVAEAVHRQSEEEISDREQKQQHFCTGYQN